MIVTRLIGGLGNQMFQYAFGLHWANQCETALRIDDAAFDTYQLHPLAIDHFNISAHRLTEQERNRIPGRYRGLSRIGEAATRAFGTLQSKTSRPLKLLREKPFGFQQHYLPHPQSCSSRYIDGYWQSEQFFPGLKQQLQQEFSLKTAPSDDTLRVRDEIQSSESVAVHVRRGDYVSDSETARIYRSLEAQYYRKCLLDLQLHVPAVKVFLFSNDIPWCLEHLDVGMPLQAVTHNDGSTAHEDLYLMSQCRHAVIANSTFSWWGAYLGEQSPSRRVYYPDPWFNVGTLSDTSIGCKAWIPESQLAQQASEQAA